MIALIDNYSTGWIHNDFNSAMLRYYSGAETLFVGASSSHCFAEFQGRKVGINCSGIRGVKDVASAIARFHATEVIFLVATNIDLLVAIIFRIHGIKVSYFLHKLNLRTRILRLRGRILYNIVEFFGVELLTFEAPHPIFKKYRIVDYCQFTSSVPQVLPPLSRHYRTIAFIGRPDEGKCFQELEIISREVDLRIIIFSDEDFQVEYETRSHRNLIDDCDFIWGYYDPDHYQGIQSGLPYPALTSRLRIITQDNIGFGSFAKNFPSYCVSGNGREAIIQFLRGYYEYARK